MKMIKSSSFFALHLAVWYLTWVTEVRSSQNGLVFNLRRGKLEELDETFTACTSDCLIGCPNYDTETRLINKYGSISGEGIYMYKVEMVPVPDPKNEPVKPIKSYIKVCDKPYKPVMVQDKETNSYETGYELFYHAGRTGLRCERYDKFQKAIVVNRESSEGESQQSNTNLVKKTKINGNTIFEIFNSTKEEDKWAYYWISVLSIQVSEQKRQISFKKDMINDFHQVDLTMFKCEDYSLEDHSNVMPPNFLKSITFEVARKSPSKDKDEKIENSDDEEDNEKDNLEEADFELLETQIMPMSYFHSLSAKLATCTYFNLAFIMKSIVIDRLEKVDFYLYSMYRTWPSQIDITFGVAGQSKEMGNTLLAYINNLDNPRLKKFPVPVPGVAYRIVEYSYNADNGMPLMRNAIVVIHTSFSLVSNAKRICPPESELQGWDGLGRGNKYKGFKGLSGLTYACPVTWETIGKLGVKYEKRAEGSFEPDENQQKEILNLKQFLSDQ